MIAEAPDPALRGEDRPWDSFLGLLLGLGGLGFGVWGLGLGEFRVLALGLRQFSKLGSNSGVLTFQEPCKM